VASKAAPDHLSLTPELEAQKKTPVRPPPRETSVTERKVSSQDSSLADITDGGRGGESALEVRRNQRPHIAREPFFIRRGGGHV